MDLILVFFILIYNIIVLIIDIRLLYIFEDPEDVKDRPKQGIIARASALFGLQLIWINYSIISINIMNQNPPLGGEPSSTVNMFNLFLIILCLNLIYMALLLPFSIFYYESELDKRLMKRPPLLIACLYTLPFIIIYGILLGISYGAFRFATFSFVSNSLCIKVSNIAKFSSDLCYKQFFTTIISFPIIFTGLIIFIGFIFNIVFIGIGLVLTPSLIFSSIINRVTPLTLEEYNSKKMEIFIIAEKLKEVGKNILKKQEQYDKLSSNYSYSFKRWSEKRSLQQKINKYRNEVIALNEYFENTEKGFKKRGENYVLITIKVIGFILSLLFTIVWICMLITSMIISETFIPSNNPLVTPWLILLSLILPIYLGICSCFCWSQFGKKICFCFPLHFLRRNETPLNSILFNIGIVLFPITSVVYLTSKAMLWSIKFDESYLIFYAASNIYLNKYFIANNIFIYCIFGVSILTIIVKLVIYIWIHSTNSNTKGIPNILMNYTKTKDEL
ncbi:hypothetical protein ACR3K2_13120 [Cryptosporidium serpentis]